MIPQQANQETMEVRISAAATADICDANPDAKVLLSPFNSYGGKDRCSGPVEIVSTRYDNSLVKKILNEKGAGRVLLVDNNGVLTCAMLGGNLAMLAAKNAWAGVVVNGAIRDRNEISAAPIAVFALATCPKRSIRRGIGHRNVATRIGGEIVNAGDLLVADADGVIVVAARN